MDVKVIRSERRVKTVDARVVDGVLVVRAPARLSDTDLAPIVQKLLTRVERRKQKEALDDGDLERWATRLNRRYYGGRLKWRSIRWVTNQNKQVGSCTPAHGTIRISHRVARMPPFVRDYVILHELTHLRVPNHGPRFWKTVNRYPKTERARGYLMAIGLEGLEDVC